MAFLVALVVSLGPCEFYCPFVVGKGSAFLIAIVGATGAAPVKGRRMTAAIPPWLCLSLIFSGQSFSALAEGPVDYGIPHKADVIY